MHLSGDDDASIMVVWVVDSDLTAKGLEGSLKLFSFGCLTDENASLVLDGDVLEGSLNPS